MSDPQTEAFALGAATPAGLDMQAHDAYHPLALPSHDLSAIDDCTDTISRLLTYASEGEPDAWNRVYSLLYDELHRLARIQLYQFRTIARSSPTSLITQAWLRLNHALIPPTNREHLVRIFGRSLRNALLDDARSVSAAKRGAGAEHVTLDESHFELGDDARLEHLFAVDRALANLSTLDERLGLVVELRYFGGLTDEEIAGMLGITRRTVVRDWRRARAFLAAQLEIPLPEGLIGASRTPAR